MNNAMRQVTEKLKKSAFTPDSQYSRLLINSAINDISAEISKAITPLNKAILPFVAAVLADYNDLLTREMDPAEIAAYNALRELIRLNRNVCKIAIPTKGGKQNGYFND